MSNADWACVINHFNDAWREPFDIEFLLCSNEDYKKPISIGDLKYFLRLSFLLQASWPKIVPTYPCFIITKTFSSTITRSQCDKTIISPTSGMVCYTVEHTHAHTHTKLIHICFWQNNNGNGNNCYFQAEITSWKNKLIYKYKYSKTSEGMII